jgi:hypothetical protein
MYAEGGVIEYCGYVGSLEESNVSKSGPWLRDVRESHTMYKYRARRMERELLYV